MKLEYIHYVCMLNTILSFFPPNGDFKHIYNEKYKSEIKKNHNLDHIYVNIYEREKN